MGSLTLMMLPLPQFALGGALIHWWSSWFHEADAGTAAVDSTTGKKDATDANAATGAGAAGFLVLRVCRWWYYPVYDLAAMLSLLVATRVPAMVSVLGYPPKR